MGAGAEAESLSVRWDKSWSTRNWPVGIWQAIEYLLFVKMQNNHLKFTKSDPMHICQTNFIIHYLFWLISFTFKEKKKKRPFKIFMSRVESKVQITKRWFIIFKRHTFYEQGGGVVLTYKSPAPTANCRELSCPGSNHCPLFLFLLD